MARTEVPKTERIPVMYSSKKEKIKSLVVNHYYIIEIKRYNVWRQDDTKDRLFLYSLGYNKRIPLKI